MTLGNSEFPKLPTNAPGEDQTVITSYCKVTLHRRVTEGTAPALLCLRGIWAPRTHLNELLHVFPREDIVIADIPGMWSPQPEPSTMQTFAAAYDEVIAQLLPDRDVVVLGVSTGAVAALALKSPRVRGIVAVEPFLSTANLWPLVQNMQHRLASNRTRQGINKTRRYIYEIFGYTEDSVEDRNFDFVLDALSVPTSVVVGSIPLGSPRSLSQWPSLTDPRARRLLAAHPRVEFYEGPPESGHNLIGSPAGLALAAQLLRGQLRGAEAAGAR